MGDVADNQSIVTAPGPLEENLTLRGQLRGWQAAVAAVCVGWGSIGVLVREVDLPAVAIVASRVWLASAALGLWLWWRPTEPSAPRLLRHRPARVMAAGAVLALHWVLFFAALQRAPIGTVLLITYLAPVGVAALAPRLLGEHLSARTVGALGVALAGVALLSAPALDRAGWTGVVLAIAAAVLFVVLVLVGKPLAEAYGGVRFAFLELAAAGVVLVPFAAGAAWGGPEPEWAWLVVLGVVHTGVGVAIYLSALARLPATQVGILGYLEPASAVVFGWVLLSEHPSALTVLGGLLVLAGGILVMVDQPATAPSSPIVPEVADVPR
jgi:drug/metabolite transporter (DMT)-like permease